MGDSFKNGDCIKLIKSAGYPSGVNAVCGYRELDSAYKETEFPYMLCIMKTPLSDTKSYTVVDVPAATWAVFVNEPHSIEDTSKETQSLVSRFYTDWLPTADYELVSGYDFEMYYDTCDNRCYEEVYFIRF